jgi:hypothetical protein
LERLERRMNEVLYEGRKWWEWVRGVQEEEEKGRMEEVKRIKMEAAMFQRNKKMVEQRARERREKEEQKRQDTYLNQVWKESRSKIEWLEDDDDEGWDPIEDMLEENRGAFIGMLFSIILNGTCY